MYRPPAASSRSGPGVSGDGYDGAESFFEQSKTVAGELNLTPSESASAKAAADAYLAARNGNVTPDQAFFQQGKVPAEFPQDMHITDAKSPMGDLGKAVGDMMQNMGDMLNQIVQGPMGILGSVLSFLMKLFTEVAKGIGEAISEAAQAVAEAVEDTWKKSMQMASQAGTAVQPLELYNQAATTQTLATALKSTTST